jgi:alpha-tubulin suppressor-like RCC1 family protein
MPRRAHNPHLTTCILMVALLVSVTSATVLVDGAIGPVPSAGAAPVVGGLSYVPLVPCRAVDTRTAGGPLGVSGARSFNVAGAASACAVPDAATAVEVSVTAVDPSADGFARLHAAGTPEPTATFLNYSARRGTTNTGTIPVRPVSFTDLTVTNHGGPTDLIVDVQGYFVAGEGLGYVPLDAPCRAVDSRGTPSGRFGNGTSRSFRVAGVGDLSSQGVNDRDGCGVPDGVAAVALSVSAIDPQGAGFARVGPSNAGPLRATFLNASDRRSTTNSGSVSLATVGALDLTVSYSGGSTHIAIDVLGYYPAAGGYRYQTVTPCRVVDSRQASGAPGVGHELGDDVGRLVQVAGTGTSARVQGSSQLTGCGVPMNAVAAQVAVTAVGPRGDGFIRAHPSGTPASGTALNYSTGASTTNVVTLRLGSGTLTDLTLRNGGGPTRYLVDVLGYFESDGDGLGSVEQIDAGGDHTCALIAAGWVRCWGDNSRGQIGDGGDLGPRLAREAELEGFPLSDIASIDVGSQHTCAVDEAHTAWCWGADDYGQLGDGTTGDAEHERNSPMIVRTSPAGPALTDVVQVATGAFHTCARLMDGTVRCWGVNTNGQVGDGTTDPINAPNLTPVTVRDEFGAVLDDVAWISAGSNHTCAQLADGTARCWGSNASGQVGDSSATAIRDEARVVRSGGGAVALDRIVSIRAGGDHTCALRADSTVSCWGIDTLGQLGDGLAGGSRAYALPVAAPGALGALNGVLHLSAGRSHSCVTTTNTGASCWGLGTYGRLGDGADTGVNRSTPAPVRVSASPDAGPAYFIAGVAAGGDHSCAAFGDGSAGCWGRDQLGQLGDQIAGDQTFPGTVAFIGP